MGRGLQGFRIWDVRDRSVYLRRVCCQNKANDLPDPRLLKEVGDLSTHTY
ncbi:hypothetical protein [Scytonema hofmannii]|nr:hypothetical protein [Scytonema hofmannii]